MRMLAAVLALVVPLTAAAQPIAEPMAVPVEAAPPVVNAQIVVPAPVVAPQPFPMTGPRTLPYEPGGPIPQGYVLTEKPRLGLIIGGSIAFGLLYITSLMAYSLAEAVCAGSSCSNDFWPLSLPVIGPFITIGTANAEGGAISLLAMDGLGQGAGLAMLILGVASKKQVWLRADLADLHLMPLALADGGRGLALAGQF